MALQDFLHPDFQQFEVICRDNVMQITGLTLGKRYTVLGMIQDFYIIVDDKKNLAKYYKDRFEKQYKVAIK